MYSFFGVDIVYPQDYAAGGIAAGQGQELVAARQRVLEPRELYHGRQRGLPEQ